MKKFLYKIGILKEKVQDKPYSYDHLEYTLATDKSKIEAHKDFLKTLEDSENNRLNLIENKTSQLISQTGIIFSLLSLFVPILIDKASELSLVFKILLLLFLFLTFLFYLLTIRNASKNLNVKKFNYSIPSPKNVIRFQKDTLENFYSEEVRDLLYCINQNTKVNNEKATNLLHSNNTFKLANLFMGILVAIFSLALFFFSPKKETSKLGETIRVDKFDSLINILSKPTIQKKDTVIVNKIDTIYIKSK